jgi:hypothetical protein
MQNKYYFESDETRIVFENAQNEMELRDVTELTKRYWLEQIVSNFYHIRSIARIHHLPVRSFDELLVLHAKYNLNTAKAKKWFENSHVWVKSLITIYNKTKNIRERAFALKTLNSIDWEVDSISDAKIIVKSLRINGMSHSLSANVHEVWNDDLFDVKNIPNFEMLMKYAKVIILERRIGLPKDIVRKILLY